MASPCVSVFTFSRYVTSTIQYHHAFSVCFFVPLTNTASKESKDSLGDKLQKFEAQVVTYLETLFKNKDPKKKDFSKLLNCLVKIGKPISGKC